MSFVVSFLAESPLGGLAAAGLNALVAFGLIALSLALCVAISLLVGLPALVTVPQRAVRAQINRKISE